MRKAALLLAAIALAGAGAEAGTPGRAADMLEKARAFLAAARTPEERLAALGRAAQAEEAALAALRADLRRGADRRAAIESGLHAKRRRLAAILSALQRIERAPRAAALAHPGGVVAGARAGMMLAALAPELEAEAATLRAALAELDELAARRAEAAAAARAALGALQRRRAEIARLLDRGEEGGAAAGRLAAEGAALARSSETLSALVALLPAAPGADTPGAARFTAARGALPPPVEGRLKAAFGAPTPGGGRLEGVALAAPPYAMVYAPWRGVIRFAAPFGEDGVVVMLEPEPDVLIVFSGLAAAMREPGDLVLAGEAIGALGGPAPAAEEFLLAATTPVEAIGRETLYMEVRRGGAPVDPAIWFEFETEEGDR
ncbi:murein hydrolase activator EnvC family protein [Pikeienuella sp. HZG-20]|uniref:murein hydrolase activator EnvC family protein n=1 Tax=Paludibacillus litoralis TaxID=3133267 RepID=UPI0030EBAAE7